MCKRLTLLLGLLLLLAALSGAAAAQDSVKPTVGFVYPGGDPVSRGIISGVLDILIANGALRHDQYHQFHSAEPVESDEVFFYFIGGEHDPVGIGRAVDTALDFDPDALVTLKERVTLQAMHTVADRQDPPIVLFSGVPDPWRAGFGQSSCVKPAHVTGVYSEASADELMGVVMQYHADLQYIGVLHHSGDASGLSGAEEILAAAEDRGLTARSTAVTQLADLGLAIEALIDAEVEAIVLPPSDSLHSAMPLISGIAKDGGVPIYTSGIESSVFGATIGYGYAHWYEQGIQTGRVLLAWLRGELDIAETAISAHAGLPLIGIDLGWGDIEGFTLSDELVAAADLHSRDMQVKPNSAAAAQELMRIDSGRSGPIEALRDIADDFLASLRCTPEMIAEQQAELDAEA